MTVNLDEGIGAPLVDRKNEVMRTMSDSEVRKARGLEVVKQTREVSRFACKLSEGQLPEI